MNRKLLLIVVFLWVLSYAAFGQATQNGPYDPGAARQSNTYTISETDALIAQIGTSGGTDWTATLTYDLKADFGVFRRAFTSVSAAGSLATYTDGPAHGKGGGAFIGGVMMPNGKVALVPYSPANVGIYDPVCGQFPIGNLLTPFVNNF